MLFAVFAIQYEVKVYSGRDFAVILAIHGTESIDADRPAFRVC